MDKVEVVLGNSNSRFSGVTSIMLQTLKHQQELIGVRVMGKHHLPSGELFMSFGQVVKLCKKPLANGLPRVFHARRNDEMIQALVLKHLFGAKIKILFTSTAQRDHSKFTKWLMSKMDAVISTCSYAANYLTFKAAAIVPHGIESQNYYPVDDKTALAQSLGFDGGKLLGIFGRVRAQKGVHLFVRACIDNFPEHEGYQAIICGAWDDEAYVSELKQEVAQAGLEERIQFIGEQPFERLPELFRACSLVAALSRNEGFGLTVLEAMSSGAAVLATEAGAWPDVVRSETDGLLLPVEDQQAVNEAMKRLLGSPELMESMGRSGRERILEHYTVEKEVAALIDIYRKLQSGTL